MQSFISLKQRLEMPFKEYGNDQYKVKVVDLKAALDPILADRNEKGMSMIVEIKSIKVDKYKDIRYSLSYSKDEKTGIFYGIPIGQHPDGNIKWRKIILTEFNTFNLKNKAEAEQWFVVRFNPYILGSPFVGVEPVFKIHDPEEEAAYELKKASALAAAINKAKVMKNSELLNFARFIGVPIPEDVSPRLLRSIITKHAVTNPIDFERKYNDEHRKLYEVFFAANALGIISHDIDAGYLFKGVTLGMNDYECVRFLQKDTLTLTGITSLLKQTDQDAKKLQDDEEEK